MRAFILKSLFIFSILSTCILCRLEAQNVSSEYSDSIYSISGKLTDSITGKPLGFTNIAIAFLSINKMVIADSIKSTDAGGNYSIHLPRQLIGTKFIISIQDIDRIGTNNDQDGYAYMEAEMMGTKKSDSLNLKFFPQPYVFGKVYDSVTRQPLPFPYLEVEQKGGLSCLTNGGIDGDYKIQLQSKPINMEGYLTIKLYGYYEKTIMIKSGRQSITLDTYLSRKPAEKMALDTFNADDEIYLDKVFKSDTITIEENCGDLVSYKAFSLLLLKIGKHAFTLQYSYSNARKIIDYSKAIPISEKTVMDVKHLFRNAIPPTGCYFMSKKQRSRISFYTGTEIRQWGFHSYPGDIAPLIMTALGIN